MHVWIWATALVLAAAFLALALLARRRRGAELAIWRDAVRISELSRAAAVEELAGWIGEEVGAPLASLLNNVGAARRLLDREVVPSEALAALDEARTAGERVAQALRQLPARSGAAGGRREPLQLNEVVREVVRLTRWCAEAQGVALSLSLDPRLPVVRGDPVQLSQMALGLVLSAVDAAAASRARTAEVGTALAEEGIELTVSDSGPLVDERDRILLFAPFSRVRCGDLGIGLAVTRAIVEAHGGRIVAERPTSGARFRVVLPAEAAALEALG